MLAKADDNIMYLLFLYSILNLGEYLSGSFCKLSTGIWITAPFYLGAQSLPQDILNKVSALDILLKVCKLSF